MIELLDRITSSAAWGLGSIYEQRQTADPHSYAVRDLLVLAGWDVRVEQRIVFGNVFNVMIWRPCKGDTEYRGSTAPGRLERTAAQQHKF